MINEYKVLNDNGLSIIYCYDLKNNQRVEVYLDTVALKYILKFAVEWKIYRGESRYSKEIKAIFPNGGLTKLKTVIGNYFFNSNLRFSIINDDYKDLRLENILSFPNRGNRGGSLGDLKKMLRLEQRSLTDRINENSMDNIQVIKFFEGLLLIENHGVFTKISNAQRDAILRAYEV